jgi:lipopolysaccharide transport system permease protein
MQNSTQGVSDLSEILIQPEGGGFIASLVDLWRYRELLYFLAWRDIKVRYKQTALGAAWAILQPFLTMLLFSIIFGYFAGLPSDGVPYPIFTLTALLPWQLFAFALTQSSTSLIQDRDLITKVFFPRLIIPLASVVAGLLDFAIALGLLLVSLFVFRVPWTWRLLTLPLWIALALVTAMSVGLWFSALNVKYRDVRYALPFVTQLWMYASPIAYSISLIPERWLPIYSLNPLVSVIEGFRWAILGQSYITWPSFWVSVGIVICFLLSGIWYFKRMEDEFADVI